MWGNNLYTVRIKYKTLISNFTSINLKKKKYYSFIY